MLRLEIKTKSAPEEVIKLASKFFGGLGLKATNSTPTSICLEGGGGRVEIVACTEGKGTSVDVVSQEWDYQVNEFIGKLPK